MGPSPDPGCPCPWGAIVASPHLRVSAQENQPLLSSLHFGSGQAPREVMEHEWTCCPSPQQANTGDLLLGGLVMNLAASTYRTSTHSSLEIPNQRPASRSLPQTLLGRCPESRLRAGPPRFPVSSPSLFSPCDIVWMSSVWSPTRPGTRYLRGPCMPGGGVLGMGTV